jgi:hypothetical protein
MAGGIRGLELRRVCGALGVSLVRFVREFEKQLK